MNCRRQNHSLSAKGNIFNQIHPQTNFAIPSQIRLFLDEPIMSPKGVLLVHSIALPHHCLRAFAQFHAYPARPSFPNSIPRIRHSIPFLQFLHSLLPLPRANSTFSPIFSRPVLLSCPLLCFSIFQPNLPLPNSTCPFVSAHHSLIKV